MAGCILKTSIAFAGFGFVVGAPGGVRGGTREDVLPVAAVEDVDQNLTVAAAQWPGFGGNPACMWMPWLCQQHPAPAPAPAAGHGGHSSAPSSGHAAASGKTSEGGTIKLYHQTSPEIGALILKNGFKPGHSGWCGGGIYFATDPKATFSKAIGPDSHLGFIVEATVKLGKLLHEGKDCAHMDADKVRAAGADSVTFNPGDGNEYVVYSPSAVVATQEYKCKGGDVSKSNC